MALDQFNVYQLSVIINHACILVAMNSVDIFGSLVRHVPARDHIHP